MYRWLRVLFLLLDKAYYTCIDFVSYLDKMFSIFMSTSFKILQNSYDVTGFNSTNIFFIDCFISNGVHILSHHVFNIFSYIVYKNVDIWCESMDIVQNISYKKVWNNNFHLSVSGLS